MRSRVKLTAGLAVAATVAVAGPALATSPTGSGSPSGTTVTTTTGGPGTRQLKVLDLAGAPLSALSLQPSVPQAFHVAVSDAAVGDLTQGFTVNAVMNNLYAANGGGYTTTHAAGTYVPSSAVTVNMPATGALSVFGAGLDALPDVVAAAGQTIPSCTTLATQTGLADILTTATALCGLTGPLVNPLTLSQAVTAVSSITKSLANIDDLTKVPFALSDTVPVGGGAFSNADYTSGIGAADTTGASGAPAPTSYTLLKGLPVASLTNIISALGLPSGLPLVSVDGTGAFTTVAAFESALQATGDATLQALVTDLAPLTGDQQAQVLNNLTGTLSTTLSNLSNELGTYNSFPTLTVAPPAGTPAATYSGTLTVTMVQP
jgi:hypothetical protein